MRIDKYLKVSRLIKRRTVAADACNKGRILINDKIAKAGSTIKEDDIIEIIFGNHTTKIRVKSIIPHVKKENAQEMYEIL